MSDSREEMWETFNNLFKTAHRQGRQIADLENRIVELERRLPAPKPLYIETPPKVDEKFEGVHLKRPFADERQTRESIPLCGGDAFSTYVPVAEGGELPGILPFEAYCLVCIRIHRGMSKSEAVTDIVGDPEQPLESHG